MCTSTDREAIKTAIYMTQALRKLARRNRRNNLTGNVSVKLFGFRFFFSATPNAKRSRQIAKFFVQIADVRAKLSRKATDAKLALPQIALSFGLTVIIGLIIMAAVVYSGV